MTIEQLIEYLKFIYNKDYKIKNLEELKGMAKTIWKYYEVCGNLEILEK